MDLSTHPEMIPIMMQSLQRMEERLEGIANGTIMEVPLTEGVVGDGANPGNDDAGEGGMPSLDEMEEMVNQALSTVMQRQTLLDGLRLQMEDLHRLHLRLLGNDDTGDGGMPSLDEITEMCHQALDTGMKLAEQGGMNEDFLLEWSNHLKQVFKDAERYHQNLGPEAPPTPTYGNEEDAEEIIDEGTLP